MSDALDRIVPSDPGSKKGLTDMMPRGKTTCPHT